MRAFSIKNSVASRAESVDKTDPSSPVIEMVGCWMTTSFENMDSAIERLGDVVAVAINGVCDAVDDTCSVIEKVGSKAAAKPVRKTKTAVPK